MSHYKHQFVIAVLVESKENRKWVRKLDKFVAANPQLFAKSARMTNGFVNYVMFWDGSSEGWVESAQADDLRLKFILLLKDAEADIYQLVRDQYQAPLAEVVQ